MKFKKPLFWDLKKPNLISYFLTPLTFLIRINNFILNLKSKKKSHRLKTICVGNIYVGGTGKTPTTIKLYNILSKLKINISTAKKFYNSQKDENMILEKNSKFITDISRKKIIDKAIQKNVELIIFDDGLQDKYTCYDLQFVCFDAKKWVGNGKLLPAGPLRENLESIKKYDGIFLKNNEANTDELINLIKKENPQIEVFITTFEPKNLNQFDQNEKYLIFSGIGNSESFKNILEKNNIKIEKEIIFPDHYQYKKNDLEKIKISADKLNAKIITTEKDFVKIRDFDYGNINFLEIGLKIKDEEKLLTFIKSRLYE